MHRRVVYTLLALLLGPPAFAADPLPAAPEPRFRALVTGFARARKYDLLAWGSLHLDGSSAVYWFATLRPHDVTPTQSDRWSCNGHTCRGAYLIASPDAMRYWLVTWSDGRFSEALPFAAVDTPRGTKPDPRWQVLSDKAILHEQAHNHGNEKLLFAIRGERFVVAQISDEMREGDDIVGDHRTFGKRGQKMPSLVGFRFKLRDYNDFGVSGPSEDPEKMSEPSFKERED